jgi:hypothetical protein
MSEHEHEFLIALKKWSIGVLITLTGLTISGSVFVYKSTVQTAVKIEYIQRDIKDVRDDVNEMRRQFYIVKK